MVVGGAFSLDMSIYHEQVIVMKICKNGKLKV